MRLSKLAGLTLLTLGLLGAQPADNPENKPVTSSRTWAAFDAASTESAAPGAVVKEVRRDKQYVYGYKEGSNKLLFTPHQSVTQGSEPPQSARPEAPPQGCDPNLNLDLASLPAIPEAPAAGRKPAEASRSPAALEGGTRGASPTGGQQGNQIISTLDSASEISDSARGMEIVQAATAARQALGQAAADDSRALAAPYQNLDTTQLGDALKRAQGLLSDAAGALDTATQSSLDAGERARFRNLYLNAADKTALGLDAIQESQEQAKQRENTLGTQSPFNGLLDQGAGGKDINPLAKVPALAQIFGNRLPSSESATSNDALVNRLVMLNGLSPTERGQVQGNLKLLQNASLKRPDGKVTSLAILHNGYVFGAKAAGTTDCSAFVSAALPADVRKARFTTLDFKQMWTYQHTGRFPNPPRYTRERAELVKSSALAFAALDLEAGDALGVGDLLVFRVDSYPAGHVFIVRSYNPLNMIAEVIEASQSAGTVRVREFPMSVEPMSAKVRYIRPGLVALRLKPTNNRGCSYAEHKPGMPGKGGTK